VRVLSLPGLPLIEPGVSWMVAAAVGAVVLGAGAGVGLWVRRRLVLVTVMGSSMEPILFSGDRVLVHRRGLARVRRGQIVVLEPPLPDGARHAGTGPALLADRLWNIKRVVALPGDPVPPGVPAVGVPRACRGSAGRPGRQPGQCGLAPARVLPRRRPARRHSSARLRSGRAQRSCPSGDGAKRKSLHERCNDRAGRSPVGSARAEGDRHGGHAGGRVRDLLLR
jgi:hypothetical protein